MLFLKVGSILLFYAENLRERQFIGEDQLKIMNVVNMLSRGREELSSFYLKEFLFLLWVFLEVIVES